MAKCGVPAERLAVYKMTKKQVMDELRDWQCDFETKWTDPELKELLKQVREENGININRRGTTQNHILKGVARKTLSELRAMASELDIEYSMQDTKGALMVKIRKKVEPIENEQLGEDTKVAYGKHRDLTYKELVTTQPNYCDWVMATYLQDPNSMCDQMMALAKYLTGNASPPKDVPENVPPPKASTSAAASSSTTAASSKFPGLKPGVTTVRFNQKTGEIIREPPSAPSGSQATAGLDVKRSAPDDRAMPTDPTDKDKDEMKKIKERLEELAKVNNMSKEDVQRL